MKIGFTTTTFRQIRSLERIVTLAKEAEIDCIEWGGDLHVRCIDDAKKAKELCDKVGISISSYASYYRAGSKDNQEWQRILEIADTLGARGIRIWLGKADSEKTDENEYQSILQDIRDMCDEAKKYGILVIPECHDNTFNNNTDAFLRIREDSGKDNFRTYFQSRYKKLGYDLDRIERTVPFIESVHISYSEQRREQFPKYDPDYIDKLLDKLLEVGFDGNLLLEYTYIFGHFGLPSSMKKDIAKLKSRIGK